MCGVNSFRDSRLNMKYRRTIKNKKNLKFVLFWFFCTIQMSAIFKRLQIWRNEYEHTGFRNSRPDFKILEITAVLSKIRHLELFWILIFLHFSNSRSYGYGKIVNAKVFNTLWIKTIWSKVRTLGFFKFRFFWTISSILKWLEKRKKF